MTAPKPSEAQIATLEELPAETVSLTEEGLLARTPEGKMVTITADGEWSAVEDPVPPEPEVIDAEAEEVPVDAGDPSEASPDEVEAAKPDAIDLVVDPSDPDSVYRVMDRADEVLILDELQERALDTFVYSFTNKKGERFTDLSVGGVNETVRLMNERGGTQIGVSEQPPVVERFKNAEEDFIRVLVFARDGRHAGSGRWGTAVEPEKQKGKWDKFAFTKALNKAQRNALKMQIPEDYRQTIIAQYLGTHHMQELKALDPRKQIGAGEVAELPPALDDDRAKAIRAEIHERFGRLRKLNRLKCPAAKLNAFLTKAETESHERMELLRDTFDEWIAEEEKRRAPAESTS